MKKYMVVIVLGLVLLPVAGYAKCCDYCVEKYFMYTPINATITTFNSAGIKKLIGKMVHRTKPVICAKSPTMYDRSYIEEPRKLLAVTNEYLILSSDILASGQFRIERDIWDDGNWEEFVKTKRLIIKEVVDNEAFYVCEIISDEYSCVRCGKQLRCSTGDNNYYCVLCKTGFNIKEE